MKYYTSKLWQEMNCGDKSLRIIAEKQWEVNSREYHFYFQEVSSHLSKKFLSYYYKYHGFHDSKIVLLTYLSKRNAEAYIQLAAGKKILQITFKGVERFVTSIVDKSYCILNEMSWGYAEFELLDDGRWRLNILCDVYNEIELIFRKLIISDVSK